MTASEFQHITSSIPHLPGIYKYYNKEKELIYVGKAKNIRKRVSSYFIKRLSSYKTQELVKHIHHIEFTIVNSEQDAFFLENSLIKNFQPKYNINLKDDKTYPHIVIKNEPYPRVFLTRKLIPDGSEYLGPYTSVQQVRELLNFIKKTIPLRTCTLNLTENNIKKKKFKVCLEYYLGNCKGPCEGFQSAEDYQNGLLQIRNLLKGNLNSVIHHFKNEMKLHAQNLEFEKAELIKKKISFLKNYQSGSVISNAKLGNLDVFFIERSEEKVYLNYLMVQNGTIVQTKSFAFDIYAQETVEEILVIAVSQIRSIFNSSAPEIVLPFKIQFPEEGVKITVPKAGDKKKLLDLSEKNVTYFIDDILNKKRLKLDERNTEKGQTLIQLQKDLRLSKLPVHIECFDNSNFQGSFPVSAMVCFKNGEPSKKDYRLFNVKTVSGINDFATMKEAVGRRYKRVHEEGLHWPQLVIIDGGKGQLNAAVSALEEIGAASKTTLIGLAKNAEEIFFAGDKESLKLPYNSNSLHLVRFIRDEVHRIGINFHRKKRSTGALKNELDDIKGIGKESINLLLKEFRSVKNIKSKSLEDLTKITGLKKAKLIFHALKK